jgi:hypothetical protein
MVTKKLNKIFLSASIPTIDRDKGFYDTADIIAIRDAVRALAVVIIPHAHLVWGGHPSITPVIRYVMERSNSNLKQHVTLYQSRYFEHEFPEDNAAFETVLTESTADLKGSLNLMRMQMLEENDFKAAFFIGGMEGIFEEHALFIKAYPNAIVIPVASTGAAAKELYHRNFHYDSRLLNDYAYMSLFKDLLSDILN